MSPHTSLTLKLSDLLIELQRQIEERHVQPNFGTLRQLLGSRRILILPHIKTQHEVILPDATPEMARATVLVEIALVDAECGEQLTSRWIGQAIDAPMLATEKAITHAMEDFLQKTFLILPDATSKPRPQGQGPGEEREEGSAIRRRPQGAHALSPGASPVTHTAPVAPEPAQEKAPLVPPAPSSSQAQLDLLSLMPSQPALARAGADTSTNQAANEDAPSDPLPPLTKEWKSANALWRALVNEVGGAEIMEAFEDALERHHQVDSWRRLSPAQIRNICQQLKKRSALPSDRRMMSDREEFILSRLPFIPEGSSMNRLEEELERLTLEVVDRDTCSAFFSLYLDKMNADSLAEVPGKAAIALARKMRRLKPVERDEFIHEALTKNPSSADTSQDSTAA